MLPADMVIIWAAGPPQDYLSAVYSMGEYMGNENNFASTAYVVTTPEHRSEWARVVKAMVIGTDDPVDMIRKIASLKSILEHLFFRALLRANIDGFVPQFKMGDFTFDFAIPRSHLVIEVDSAAYHSGKDVMAKDAKKGRFIQSKGWTIFRFTDKEINEDVDALVMEVYRFINP